MEAIVEPLKCSVPEYKRTRNRKDVCRPHKKVTVAIPV